MKRTTMLVLAVLAGMAVQHCIAGEMGDDALADGGSMAQVFEGRFKSGGPAKVGCNPLWGISPPSVTVWAWNEGRAAAAMQSGGIALDAAGCLAITGGTPGAPYQVVIR